MFKKAFRLEYNLSHPPKYKQSHKISACLIALLSLMLLSTMAFGQGASASLAGMITDPTGAVIPGATVVVSNVETGVATRTTANNAGAYNFPSLQTGTYTVAVDAAGFSRATITNVRLTVGAQIRLNFPLAVAGTVTEVEVSGSAESLSLEAGASTGVLMQEQAIQAVPLLSGSVMDMVAMMGGVSTSASGQAYGATMAGIGNSMNINIVRDGVSVNEVRMPVGISASTNINPEMIGEFRVVLAPVDAEMGRGAGQVQMTTRSGSNQFRGSAIWNVQNTALDARDFSIKLSGTPPNWRNLNSYVLSASGPIIRNKTFFFVTWEQQFSRDKLLSNVRTMTPCARKGIYRYLGGTVPAVNNVVGSYNGSTMAVPSVNADGTPRTSGSFYNVNNPDQTYTINPVTNALHIESIFGEFTDSARAALLAYPGSDGVWGDCSGINLAPQATTAWSNDTSGFYTSGITSGNLLKPNSYWGESIYRSAYDPTGFAGRFIKSNLSEMPPANNFEITGDGLNLAAYRWHVPFVGTGANVYGQGGDPDRKSITFKIDHNINNDHRLSGTFTKEYFFTNDVNGSYAPGGWPSQYGGYNGDVIRRPFNFLFSLTSTLRPTLLNELRFGMNRSNTWTHNPIDSHTEVNQVLADLMNMSYSQGVQTIVGAGEGQFLFHVDQNTAGTSSHPIASRNMLAASWGGHDPRYTISDTVTWMKGTHSIKGGFEYRKQSSVMEYSGMKSIAAGGGALMNMPTIWGGTTTLTLNRRNALSPLGAANRNSTTAWQDLSTTSLDTATTTSGNYTTPYEMMSYFSGSVNQARQYFYYVPDASSPTGARWNNTLADENWWTQTLRNQEFSFFFKDDWKVTSDLTLNLGIRYEYYGIASVDGGTLKMMGSSFDSAFGVTKGGWTNWMNNRQLVESTYDPYISGTSYIPNFPAIGALGSSGYTLVGPGSQNSDILPYSKDKNNFAPHIGFSWQLPWFGRGQTTLRGGWSVSYLPVNDFNFFEVVLAKLSAANTDRVERFQGLGSNVGGVPGSTNDSTAYYMDMSNLSKSGQGEILGNSGYFFEPTRMPLENFRLGELMYSATVMDENITNPYVHSFNMAVTRQIGRAVTLDVRYVGTMSQNMIAGANGGAAAPINSVRYINNVSPAGYNLLTELEKVRGGGYESPLLNSLIPQASLYSSGGGGSGSNQLLNASSTSANMALGQYANVAGTLSTGNGLLSPPVSGLSGMIFRGGCLPEDREGYLAAYASDPTVNAYNFTCTKGTPWNYYMANPQYTGMSLQYNAGSSNYHSLQTQITLRPTRGLSFQASYTWSRNLSDTGYSNYLDDPFTGREYILAGQHRSHALNTFGSYELPLGTNGLLLRNASGVLKKIVEGWQLNWVTTISSGVPVSVTGTNGQWTNTRVDLVRSDLWDNKAGEISTHWRDDGTYIEGLYFGNKYIKVLDRNICDPGKMTAALYSANCEYLAGGRMALRASAPRALALHSGKYDQFGDPIPLSYSNVQEAVAKGDQLAQTYYDANAQIDLTPVVVFRNHYQGEGTQGNFKQNQLTGQGRFTFDLAMAKAIEFMEGKRFEIRVDAQNILNHPTATASTSPQNGGRIQSISGPSLSISNATTFGLLATKASHRTFQARLRLSF